MDSEFILDAIRRKYPAAAIVPEITISDYDIPDSGEAEAGRFFPPPRMDISSAAGSTP